MGRGLCLAALALLSLGQLASSYTVICYHGTWAYYRNGNGGFKLANNFDPTLCTHYIYSFVGLDSTTNKVVLLDSWLDVDLGQFSTAVALKQKNPNLKVLLAVGGWNQGSARFSVMAADANKRSVFIQSVVSLLSQYGFDGFDLDWEYPGRRDSSNSADKENFSTLIKEMRAVFDQHGWLLTAAVSATPSSVDISYDVPVLSQNLDYIHVMTYDFFGSWDNTVGHNAPLYGSSIYDGTTYAEYNVDASIQGWLSRGANASKIALGVPFYGRTFALSSVSTYGVGAAVSGAGPAGPYTATAGFWGYNEIVEQFQTNTWAQYWDDTQEVPYAIYGSTWLSYPNTRSLTLKANYAKKYNLAGVMIWSIETDDFLGLSGTKYPLLKALNDALGRDVPDNSNNSESSSTDSKSDSGSSSNPTSDSGSSSNSGSDSGAETGSGSSDVKPNPSSDSLCTSPGVFRDPSDCSKFYTCSVDSSNNLYVSATTTCTRGLLYDTRLQVCNWSNNVECPTS